MNRAAEFQKYEKAYRRDDYRMGAARLTDAQEDLRSIPVRGKYLDVSCGRGEMLKYAKDLGFEETFGTEVVGDLIAGSVIYAEAHALPFHDKRFNVVSLFDVIEHLLPGDDKAACEELARVATDYVLLTANNRPSNSMGMELHVNRRPYDEWDELFREWFPRATVNNLGSGRFDSVRWVIEL